MNQSSNNLSQVKILHDFLKKLHITQAINIAGNSMSGEISTFYTMKYPGEIKTLAFFGSPSGVVDFSPIFIRNGFKQGFNPFVPTTLHQFKEELFLLTPNYKKIMPPNNVIVQNILPLYKNNYERLTTIFNVVNITENRNGLNKTLPITQPSLVMWGDHDRVFGKTQYGRRLFNNLHMAKYKKTYVIKDAGHLLLLGDNKVINLLALHYLRFLQKFN